MSPVRLRRSAYRFIAQAITRSLEDVPWTNEPAWPEIEAELLKHAEAFKTAANVEDAPDVENHADGQPIVVGCTCEGCSARRKKLE